VVFIFFSFFYYLKNILFNGVLICFGQLLWCVFWFLFFYVLIYNICSGVKEFYNFWTYSCVVFMDYFFISGLCYWWFFIYLLISGHWFVVLFCSCMYIRSDSESFSNYIKKKTIIDPEFLCSWNSLYFSIDLFYFQQTKLISSRYFFSII